MLNPFEALEKRLSSIEEYLSVLSTNFEKLNPHQEIDTIGIDEVAKMLNLSINTVYTKTSDKSIPHAKRGKKLIFSRAEIKKYIEQGKVKAFGDELRETQKLISEKINRNRR